MKLQVNRSKLDLITQYEWAWQNMLPLLGLGVATFLAAILGLILANHSQQIPILWLPSGIVISVLLLTSREKWLPIFLVFVLAIFLAFLVENYAVGTIIGFSFAYTAEATLATLIIQRIIGQKTNVFSLRQIGVAAIFIGSVLLLIALLGASVALLSYQAPFINTALAWAMADGLGILILVPIVLAWAAEKPSFRNIRRGNVIETVILLALMVITTWLVFFSTPKVSGYLLSLPFVVYPFLFWAGFRLGTFGAASASSLLAVMALWSAIQGYGPFSSIEISFESRMLSVQLYLLTSTLFAWMVVALINERKFVEKAWQSSEKHMRSILENAPVFIGQIGPGGKMSFNNWSEQNASEPFAFFAPLTPESESLLSNAIKIARTTGRPWQSEVAAKVNGRQSWYQVQLNPILSEGRMESIILTANEITERKTTEKALRESEERFSVAVRGANDGIWDWDVGIR